jgi:hypothetical protein
LGVAQPPSAAVGAYEHEFLAAASELSGQIIRTLGLQAFDQCRAQPLVGFNSR